MAGSETILFHWTAPQPLTPQDSTPTPPLQALANTSTIMHARGRLTSVVTATGAQAGAHVHTTTPRLSITIN
jgi:hypothetical protein